MPLLRYPHQTSQRTSILTMNFQAELTVNTTAFDTLTGSAPLFACSSNGEPYDAYLLLDKDGTVDFELRSPRFGGTPIAEWHGLTRSWIVPSAVRGFELQNRCILELLQRVHDGRSVEWDGNNHVGVLDEDAEAASKKLTSLLGSMAVWEVCAADSWLSSDYVIANLWTAGKSLRDVVADIFYDAYAQGILIAADSDAIENMLCKELLNRFKDDKPFKLTAEQSEALLNYVSALVNR